MLSLLMVLMQSIVKVTFEMLYFFIVWVCKISLKSMFRSYVSKFKLSIFHFRCNSLYNLNNSISNCVMFRSSFHYGFLKFFSNILFFNSFMSNYVMLSCQVLVGYVSISQNHHVVQSITSGVCLYWYVLSTYVSTYYFQVIT